MDDKVSDTDGIIEVDNEVSDTDEIIGVDDEITGVNEQPLISTPTNMPRNDPNDELTNIPNEEPINVLTELERIASTEQDSKDRASADASSKLPQRKNRGN